MKISTFLLVKCLVLIASVKVWSQSLNCKESKLLGCPDIVCNLITSRKSDFCKDVQCEGLHPMDCPIGTEFENGLTMCGCCSGCAKYQELGEPCEVSAQPPSLDPNCTRTDPMSLCPILKNNCKPGLVCKYLGESSKVCAVDPSGGAGPGLDSCIHKRNLGLTNQLHWTPTCEEDGSYSPKQCKGTFQDGICFCVNSEGKRIFGREWWNKAANQTCDCSRHVYKLRQAGNIAAIHCSSDGNYEPLQCDMDSGLCYCVDTITGKLDGAVLPEHQWKLLPCYSVNLTQGDPTGQYLRRCESQWGAGQRIRKEALLHGLDVFAVADFTCDYDGSFGPLRRDKSTSYCVPKNGNMEEGRAHKQEMEKAYMDCQCFRDSLLYEEEGRPFLKSCDPETGNYALISALENEYSCVDYDGFFYGDIVEEKYTCCLLGDCSNKPKDVQDMCFDPVTQTGKYHKCDRQN